ncbi:serine/threonine-protein kinase [Streptomyces sp. PR69]|uniref:serine/threonine-protein kinase n=1 Tax=Streptomyces sp. PR69 TaxID=2984950 RepID=UPI0022646376|nr:serine/threonine-protein kinase [Streptomyces sp. PR69]
MGGWEVTEPIAAGSWATVYEGRAAGDGTEPGGQRVALKFLPTAGLAPRQARSVVETARREIDLGRRVRHPGLIRLLDFAVLSEPDRPALDGAVVLVMERARGSLRDLLDAPVDRAEAARLLTGVCEGLAQLHGLGWVHGDLKPDNVLLMPDGSVKLSDFGLAAELAGTHGTHGYIPPMGTPDYLPPERWRAPLGERGVQVRPSGDIWALGIMIHEVFAGGRSPFPGGTPIARAAAVQEYAEARAPLRLDDAVPPFWRALAADCLAPTHQARAEHTAERLLARIRAGQRAWTGGQGGGSDAPSEAAGPSPGTAAAAPGPASSSAAVGRRKRTLALLTAVMVCGTAAAGGARAVRGGGSADPDAAGPAGRVQVFNAEPSCRDRADRARPCSLGLSVDPLLPYTADNVVPHRVWHGDVLAAECRYPDGMVIVDEVGTRSAEWFRVRLPEDSERATAWLPAVRTKDRPGLPECTRPFSAR